jgi:hypothetical protein
MSHNSGVPRASTMMQACLESRTSVSARSGQAPNRRQTRPGRRSPNLVARSNHAPAPGCAQQSPASRSVERRAGRIDAPRAGRLDRRSKSWRASVHPPTTPANWSPAAGRPAGASNSRLAIPSPGRPLAWLGRARAWRVGGWQGTLDVRERLLMTGPSRRARVAGTMFGK